MINMSMIKTNKLTSLFLFYVFTCEFNLKSDEVIRLGQALVSLKTEKQNLLIIEDLFEMKILMKQMINN